MNDELINLLGKIYKIIDFKKTDKLIININENIITVENASDKLQDVIAIIKKTPNIQVDRGYLGHDDNNSISNQC